MYSNKDIWKVSYPILLSLFAQNVINVTDTAFLGRVSDVAVGASAMGGIFYICFYTVAFGFSVGSQILMARRNGENRFFDVGPIMTQGVIFLSILALFLFGFTKVFGGDIMRPIISSDHVYDATMEFLNWRIYGFFFSFINVMFRALYISITRTKVLTANAIIMAVVNIVLDYALIFGNLGLPEMGIKGAAIASVISEGVSILFLLIYTWLTVNLKKYGFTNIRHSFNPKLLSRILSISSFTMLQYFLSFGSWFVFFIAVERLGEKELAVSNVVRSIYVMLLIPTHSLAATANSLVSNTIGAGKIEHVKALIWKITRMSLYIMLVLVLITAIFPTAALGIYTNEPTTIQMGVSSVYVVLFSMLVASVANVLFGAISGTGNTKSALVLELVVLVLYTGYIWIVGIMMKQPVHICFTAEIVYYAVLFTVSYIYLTKGKWQNKQI